MGLFRLARSLGSLQLGAWSTFFLIGLGACEANVPPQHLGGSACGGRVAIQVEGKRKGMIDIEDRLVVVKAKSEREAEVKLSRQWRDYSEPYLTPCGELVRWKLTEIQDIYKLFDDEINPHGTEVYSRIRKRKMKASDRWVPAK